MEIHFKIHSSYTFPPINNDIPTLQSPTLRKNKEYIITIISILKQSIASITKAHIIVFNINLWTFH